MNKCEKCDNRTYVFSNAKFKHIKVKYCPKCKIYYLAENQRLNFGEIQNV